MHTQHAVKGGAPVATDSTEMSVVLSAATCVNVEKRSGSVFMCAVSQNVFFGSVALTSNTCASCLYST